MVPYFGCFCFKGETHNLQLQHVTVKFFFLQVNRGSVFCAQCARMTHTNCNLKCNMFCQPFTEFYIRVTFSFQVSASKGREGGSTYLVACFLFLCPPPTLHISGESTTSLVDMNNYTLCFTEYVWKATSIPYSFLFT